jgi:branched-chain amino acid transport system permease protein
VLMGFYNRYIDPNMYGWMVSVMWIIIVFFGGRDSLTGTLLGAMILLALPEILRFASEWRITLYCVIILLIINLRPKGLFGYWELSIKPLINLFSKKQAEVK